MISAASSNEYLKNSTNKTATALNRLNFELGGSNVAQSKTYSSKVNVD